MQIKQPSVAEAHLGAMLYDEPSFDSYLLLRNRSRLCYTPSLEVHLASVCEKLSSRSSFNESLRATRTSVSC